MLVSEIRGADAATARQLVEDEVHSLVGAPWSRKGDSPLRRNGATTSSIYLDEHPLAEGVPDRAAQGLGSVAREEGTRGEREPALEQVRQEVALELGVLGRDRKLNIVFMGGEPTAAFPLIREVVHGIEAVIPRDPEKLRFDITTNGTLITDEMMRFFANHNVMVLLSLDGDRATHDLKRRTIEGEGTFDEIVKRLAIVRRYQSYLGTKMTPTAETVHNLLHDVQTVVGLGFRRVLIGPATGVDWPEDRLAVLAEQIRAVLDWRDTHPDRDQITLSFDEVGKQTSLCGHENRWGCRAGRTGIAIDVDGALFPCSKIIGTDKPRGSQMHMGDVFHGIVDEEMHLRLNGYIPTNRALCWSCGLRGACLGGCYAANIEVNGSPWVPAPDTCSVAEVVLRVAREHLAEKEDLALRTTGLARARRADQTDELRPR